MIVGLTGGIGSGKSTVAQYFKDYGVLIVDTDEIARQLLEPEQHAFKKVIHHFGKEILKTDGTLDRSQLRKRIFESATERYWLEELLHPLIKSKVLGYSQKSHPYFIVEIPLLIEAHFENVVDRILVVDCPSKLQIERIQKRDGASIALIQKMIQSQIDRNTRMKKADDIIENFGSRDALKNKVLRLHQYYTKLSK